MGLVEDTNPPANLLEGPEFDAIVSAVVTDEQLRLELEGWLLAA